MGRKKANNKGLSAASGSRPQISMTLREQLVGKRQSNVNAQTMLKLDHLKNLATWAIEANIPSLGAYFGERLAASYEALGIPPDPSLFSCERCESILQAGHNCTVRIETNKARKGRRHNKKKNATKNNVVYTCHFCSHRNLLRGTPKGYMKEICPPKTKQLLSSYPTESPKVKSINTEANEMRNTVDLPIAAAAGGPSTLSPATPVPGMRTPLLESMRRKRSRSSNKKAFQTECNPLDVNAENSVSASNKKRRKSWTSLKDIVESSKQKLTI